MLATLARIRPDCLVPQFKVFNLCSERKYESVTFEKGGDKEELGAGGLGGECAYYPFDDHNPAPLETIKACCDDMAAFLDKDPANVVAVHCKAGKVRAQSARPGLRSSRSAVRHASRRAFFC